MRDHAAKLLVAAVAAAALALSAGASAGPTSAGPTSVTTRDVPLHGERELSGRVGRFDLVGVRWRGSGSVQFRVRSTSGEWGAWLDAAPEEGDRPDRGTREDAAAGGWRLGSPVWVGPADGIRYRLSGRVTALRASFVRSPTVETRARTVASAASPPIVPRSGWGADETIRKAEPSYAPAIRFATVHHTAGPNAYTRAEAAAIVRGIQAYHVKSNGWNDIGYNFLVDRFGTVYEGRYGGIDQNVVGAHAQGFNTGSVGVAVMGSFEKTGLPAAAQASLERLLAWRLDQAHVDPASTLTFVSGGSDRYPAGTPVLLNAVSGHRDVGLTVCPGDLAYTRLAEIAARTQAIGLPKLYEPVVTRGPHESVRFRARLSAALPWRVTVTDSLGQQLGTANGQGVLVDWTWDPSPAAAGGAAWRIEVTGVTAATGTLGGTGARAPLAIATAVAEPATISPNGDGLADLSTITFTTTATATVTATLLDAAGAPLGEILPATRLPAGPHSFTFDGTGRPDGSYTIAVAATDAAGLTVSSQLPLVITRTLGFASVDPALFTPNGDGRGDRLTVSFSLAVPATVRIRFLRDDAWVATLPVGPLPPGPQAISWDGAKRVGHARDGSYTAVVEATDELGPSEISLPFALDANPPVVRFAPGPPRLWVSEAATLTIRVNGSLRALEAPGPGYLPLTGIRKARSLVVVARDPAGNRSVLRRP